MSLMNRVHAMRRGQSILAIGATGALLAALAGCQSNQGDDTNEDDPIKVGTIYDISGGLSAIGTPKLIP